MRLCDVAKPQRFNWLGRLILTFVGLDGLAGFCLALGCGRRDGPWLWTIGALLGALMYAGYFSGLLRKGWAKSYAERSQTKARRGRVHFSVGALLITGVLYVLVNVGGAVSVFALALCGGSIAATAIWFTVYVPRNWEKVRSRLGAPPA